MLQGYGHLATERPFPNVSVVLTHLFFKKFNEVLNEVSMKFQNKVAFTGASARIIVKIFTKEFYSGYFLVAFAIPNFFFLSPIAVIVHSYVWDPLGGQGLLYLKAPGSIVVTPV